MFLRHGFPISSQTLLDLLREKAQEMAQGKLLKDRDPTKAPPKSTLASQDSTLQDLQRLRNTKKMHNSGCFGHKIDRIGSVSRLGCNGELLPCRFTASCTPAPPPSHPHAHRQQRPLGLLPGVLAQPSTLLTVFRTKAACQKMSHGSFITFSQVTAFHPRDQMLLRVQTAYWLTTPSQGERSSERFPYHPPLSPN